MSNFAAFIGVHQKGLGQHGHWIYISEEEIFFVLPKNPISLLPEVSWLRKFVSFISPSPSWRRCNGGRKDVGMSWLQVPQGRKDIEVSRN